MKPTFNPAWLVSLMARWSIKQLRVESGALGYPQKACGFSEKTTGGYSHSDPVSFNADDFADLEIALDALRLKHESQCVALLMYYKPWCVAAMTAEGWPFNNSTYYKRLHAAHDFVATAMDDMRPKVEYIDSNSVG